MGVHWLEDGDRYLDSLDDAHIWADDNLSFWRGLLLALAGSAAFVLVLLGCYLVGTR